MYVIHSFYLFALRFICYLNFVYLACFNITAFNVKLVSCVKIGVVSEERRLDRNSRRRTCLLCGHFPQTCSF